MQPHYFCPACDSRMLEVDTELGAAGYVCSNPRCRKAIPALSIDDIVLRRLNCGYTCARCTHPVMAVLMADYRVICTCPRCRHRNRQFEEALAEREQQRRMERERAAAELAHIPFERVTSARRSLTDNPTDLAFTVIRRNRTERRKHERLARPGRDRAGNLYCVRHQRWMRRCAWGFFCPVPHCTCTYRP